MKMVEFGNSASQNGITFLNEGLKALDQNHRLEAIELLEKAVQHLSNHDEENLLKAYMILGINYKRENKLRESYVAYSEAEKYVNDAEEAYKLYTAFGKVCYLLDKSDEAVQNYTKALRAEMICTNQHVLNEYNRSLLHHLGHALFDFEPELPNLFREQIPEYKKTLMGEPHSYNQNLIDSYVDFTIRFLEEAMNRKND